MLSCFAVLVFILSLLGYQAYVALAPIYFVPFHSPFSLQKHEPGAGVVDERPWTFCNFDRQACCNGTLHFPTNVETIANIVTAAAAAGQRVRVVGAGHSMSPIVCDENPSPPVAPLVLLSLDRMDRILAFDRQSMTVTAEAGIRLKNFNQALAALGLQLYNMGLIDEQSIAGLTATGVHGTGAQLKSVSNAVVSMDVVLANGTVATFNATSHPDIFRHSRLHLGLFGVVARLTFRIRDAVPLVRRHRYVPMEQALSQFDEKINSQRHYQFWWVTYTDLALLNEIDEATPEEDAALRISSIRASVDKVLSDVAFLAMSAFAKWWPHQAYRVLYLLPYLMPERDFSGPAWQLLTFPGINYHTVRYTEMEYFVDRKVALHAIRASEAFTVANRDECPVNAFHPIRSVKADDIPLSPMYKRDSIAISFVMIDRPEFAACAAKLESTLRAFGGRPHWGKRHNLTRQNIDAMYADGIVDFRSAVRSVDPQGTFRTQYFTNLLGI